MCLKDIIFHYFIAIIMIMSYHYGHCSSVVYITLVECDPAIGEGTAIVFGRQAFLFRWEILQCLRQYGNSV